jgi:SGNH hydrolase-like domain, acetyltransferase AlgX
VRAAGLNVRGRRILSGGMLALTAATVLLALLEGGLRLFAPQTFFMENAFREDPEVGLRHVAHYRGRSRAADYDVPVTTNALGFRGPEVPPRGSALRVLALGDSFTFGLGVQDDEGFAARLRRRWSQRGVEVVNAGQVDMGPENEWRLLRSDGPRLEPDVVLLAFYVGNDVRDVMLGLDRARVVDGRLLASPHARRWYRPLVPGRLLDAVPVPAASEARGLKRALGRHSHLYRFLSGRAAILREWARRGGGPAAPVFTILDDEAVCIREEPEELRAGWERAEAAVLRIADWCRARGTALVVVVIPTAAQVEDERWQDVRRRHGLRAEDFDLEKPQRRLRAFAEASGLPLVDLLPTLRAAARSGPHLYYATDPHWTARGHEVAAEEIAARVEALGLLQRP